MGQGLVSSLLPRVGLYKKGARLGWFHCVCVCVCVCVCDKLSVGQGDGMEQR